MKTLRAVTGDSERSTARADSRDIPAPLPTFDNFPDDLKKKRRWVTWRLQRRNGRLTKKPDQSITDEREWLIFEDACEHAARGAADGIGFVLGDGYVGIDIDGCIGEDGNRHPMADDALKKLDTYAELSPSGHGLHLLIQAKIPMSRNIGKRNGNPGLEFYDGRKGSARYFTVTGERVGAATRIASGKRAQAGVTAFLAKYAPANGNEATPAVVDVPQEHATADDDVLRLLFNERGGKKWHDLFNGDHSSYPSQSEADLALCRKLRFYSRANAKQMDRLFRRSSLMRPKWDERRGILSYGEMTIRKALAMGGRVYAGRDPRLKAEKHAAWDEQKQKSALRVVSALKGKGEVAFRLLFVISNLTDPEKGEADPTVEELAFFAETNPRQVKAGTQKLERAGVLEKIGRKKASNIYRLKFSPTIMGAAGDTPNGPR